MTAAAGQWVISAIGAVTSLGPDAPTSFAAARAGLSRPRHLDVLNFDYDLDWGATPVAGHAVPGALPGASGVPKAATLAKRALDDLLGRARLDPQDGAATGLFIALSDRFVERHDAGEQDAARDATPPDEAWRSEAEGFAGRVAARCGLRPETDHTGEIFEGHAGVASALRLAMRALRERQLERCLVGGVDCVFEPRTLEAAMRQRVLKTDQQPAGYMPGEAAAFLLVESAAAARGRGLEASCEVRAIAKVRDEDHRFSGRPPLGRAIAKAVRSVADVLGEEQRAFDFVIADLNGDPVRAQHWGSAIVSLVPERRLPDAPAWLPAMAFGETGAASGALAIGMAASAYARGYAPGPWSLAWSWSEQGLTSAVALRAAKGA